MFVNPGPEGISCTPNCTTVSRGLTTEKRNPPSLFAGLTVAVIENSEYSFSGINSRYGDFMSDPAIRPYAGKPSRPSSKYCVFGLLNGTPMACSKSYSRISEKKR